MPHEKLQPLRDLQSDPKETLNILKQTKEELNTVGNEAAEAAKIELDAVLAETKENIAAASDIPEAELLVLIDDVIKDLGGYVSREELMNDLGLKGIVDNSEFINLDEDAVISDAELIGGGSPENNDDGEVTDNGFNKDVKSVFDEYWQELKTVESVDKLEEFLLVKMEEALTEIENKYKPKEAAKTSPSVHSEAFGGGQSSSFGNLAGLGEMFSSEGTEDTPLSKFYKAILYKSSVNEKAFFVNGKFDRLSAKGAMETQIGMLIEEMKKPGSKTFEQYKAELTPPKPGTPKAIKREADLIEGIPENFRRSSFEDNYHKYIQTCIKNEKPAKSFDEWLVERPKPGGIMGMFDQIKVLFASSGLGKWLKDIFGADSWITNLFGGKEEAEEAEDADFDEQKDKPDGYSNRKAYEIMKDQVKIKELSDATKWEGVAIEGFIGLTEDALQEKIGTLKPEDKDVLKNVLNASASENSVLVMARAMTFDLPLLTKLDGIKGNIEHKAGENSFTLNDDPSKTPYTITVDGITKAANDVATLVKDAEGFAGHEEQVEDVSNWSEDAFAGSERIFANLQPALKGLLKLDAKYWEEFKLDKAKVEKFLDAMVGTGSMVYTSKFKNEEGAFKADGTSFLVKKGGGWLNSEKDENYTTVKSFFETL